MTDKRFLQEGFSKKLSHFIEECGEVTSAIGDAVAAAGKTQRWGLDSVNPLLEPEDQEKNKDWIIRSMDRVHAQISDLEEVWGRLLKELRK